MFVLLNLKSLYAEMYRRKCMKLRFEGCQCLQPLYFFSTLEMCLFDYLRRSNIILTIFFKQDDIFQP